MFSSQNSQVSNAANYIEDVFSTYLYTGTGANRSINNGIDLSTKGGMTWFKSRSNAINNSLYDTARGATNRIVSNSTSAQQTSADSLTSFNIDGFSLGSDATYLAVNNSGYTYASWTFAKQPKFFDVQTYTGDGTFGRTINHNLGSVPGCVMIKRTDAASQWLVWHRGMDNFSCIYLNQTYAKGSWLASSTGITDTTMRVDGGAGPMPGGVTFDAAGGPYVTNTSGAQYIVYLFAHNAGGFGLTGTDNVISCGSFTSDALGNATVSLGYEPQWLMAKRTDGTGNWIMLDTMRGWFNGESVGDKELDANTSGAELGGTAYGYPTATGFQFIDPYGNTPYIYIAIRRGPMKVPTDGTKVFVPVLQSNSSTPQSKNYGFVTDSVLAAPRNSAGYANSYWSRLQGANRFLQTQQTAAEETTITDALIGFDYQTGVRIGADSGGWIQNLSNFVHYAFQRAPNFFDEVCYTGTGSARTVTHNLTVAPELLIVKDRGNNYNWLVYSAALGAGNYLTLQTNGASSASTTVWNNTSPTSTVFTTGSVVSNNGAGNNYVALLFATCPGVSKVGSYTGNGSSQTINCGFTGGARFILIKRTDSTGDWYVWDTARGIVSGNDGHLSLNTTAAEVTTDDSIDPDSSGFIVNQVAATNINVSTATYIYLAIA